MRRFWVMSLLLGVLAAIGAGCASQETADEPMVYKAVIFERSGGIAGRHDVLRVNQDRSYAFDATGEQPIARMNRSDFERLMTRVEKIDWQSTDREYVSTDGAADFYTYRLQRVFQQGKREVLEPALVCTDVGLNHCPRETRELIYIMQSTRARLEQ